MGVAQSGIIEGHGGGARLYHNSLLKMHMLCVSYDKNRQNKCIRYFFTFTNIVLSSLH